jgi:hypothetical protein
MSKEVAKFLWFVNLIFLKNVGHDCGNSVSMAYLNSHNQHIYKSEYWKSDDQTNQLLMQLCQKAIILKVCLLALYADYGNLGKPSLW